MLLQIQPNPEPEPFFGMVLLFLAIWGLVQISKMIGGPHNNPDDDEDNTNEK
jgi:hypothetical protein